MEKTKNRLDELNDYRFNKFGELRTEEKTNATWNYRNTVKELTGNALADLQNEVKERFIKTGSFDLSLNQMISPRIIGEAIQKLNRKSAPGIDNKDVYRIMSYGASYCYQLNADFKKNGHKWDRYKIHRKLKEKGSPEDYREIGIFTTKDKIFQKIISEVLEQIYEPQFVDNSFGYRVGRSSFDGVDYIESELNKDENNYAVVIDIRKYFDSIPHGHLINILRKQIKNEELLNLIEGFLKSIKIVDSEMVENPLGTPQGSILGPILSNIFLHTILDIPLLQKHSKMAYVRFADDFLCFTKTLNEAEEIKEFISEVLGNNGLRISTKTGEPIRNSKEEPIFFLGYKIEFKEGKYIALPSADKIRKRQGKLLDSIASSMETKLFLSDPQGQKDIPKYILNMNFYMMINKYINSYTNYLIRSQDRAFIKELNREFLPELKEVLFSMKMENYQRRNVRKYIERRLIKHIN
ncbi:reverse transcriptase/maturase family protein [Leptospira alstonii]|uniref:RNA-directed DNA polymerase n=2 Tax=Leptospira alstonii TaxID=28452 RepID=M6CQU0_9LEPT|nr:reverse transcriptase/maturase family protein [Leptospira alstonii]EMJ94074.1 RNA-directed DNA polymerase [Leptospira alstonii serovar Sichuan str. 79601]EQA80401.1 putative group II intron reverse transcriptase/maturase [Leptospira alstonii serovar Pingchang str. 80-412]